MSAGLLRTRLLWLIAGLRSPPRLRRGLLATLDELDEGFIQFVYEAAADGGLGRRELLDRGAAVLVQYAAIQLSDDLSDNECGYLAAPDKDGPLLLLALQNLFHRLVCCSSIPPKRVVAALELLAAVANAQSNELHSGTWTLRRYRSCAEQLTGKQLSAYLMLLWAGTLLEKNAVGIGRHLGRGMHIAGDVRSDDWRWRSLERIDRKKLLLSARRSLDTLERCSSFAALRQGRALKNLLSTLPTGRGE
ncbi:MAG: hypothetical protein JW768_16065 [Chitinispirillaceae bacterium]|nr:hypothetical protein [Chitinispirillaceae bacterium]